MSSCSTPTRVRNCSITSAIKCGPRQLLGLTVKISKDKLKKIDVYQDNVYIASIGDSRYNDYPNYIIICNKEYAHKRRNLYINRHKQNADLKYSKQWLALNLLW